MELLTPLENAYIDEALLRHTPPCLHPEPDLGKQILGTIVTPKGWWMLVDRRTQGPLFAHA